MKSQSIRPHAVTMVRVAFWGQLIGFLGKAAFLTYEDAPDIFARVSPLAVLLALVGIAGLYFLRVDRFVATNLSPVTLTLFVLGVSGATTLLALLLVIQAYRVPVFLLTPGWQYTRATSIVVLALFAVALAANVFVIARGSGSEMSQTTPQDDRNAPLRSRVRR